MYLRNTFKDQAFHQTWTANIPFCRFVEDPTEIPQAAEALLAQGSSAYSTI